MTRLAVLAALVLGTGVATAADVSTPAICGPSGCTRLPTATLAGLLTLPDALEPTDAPSLQPYFVFHVTDHDGRASRVLYVPSRPFALLQFPGAAGWRRVPADDARLLIDAAATATPFPAPTTGPLHAVFATDESGGSLAAWAALGGVVGLVALVIAAAESRRRGRARTPPNRAANRGRPRRAGVSRRGP